MERLSQLHGPCEIEHDMGACYSVVLLVSWLSRAPFCCRGHSEVVMQETRCHAPEHSTNLIRDLIWAAEEVRRRS